MSDPSCCPYCGGANIVYEGVDNGLGPYGDCFGDMYYCEDCDLEFEGYIIPYGAFLDEDNDEDDEA